MQPSPRPRGKLSPPLFTDTEDSREQPPAYQWIPKQDSIPEQSRKFKKMQGPGFTFQQFSTLCLDWRCRNLKDLNILQVIMINQSLKLQTEPLAGKPSTFGLALIYHIHACKASENLSWIGVQYVFILSLALHSCDVEQTRRGKEGRGGRKKRHRKRKRKI